MARLQIMGKQFFPYNMILENLSVFNLNIIEVY